MRSRCARMPTEHVGIQDILFSSCRTQLNSLDSLRAPPEGAQMRKCDSRRAVAQRNHSPLRVTRRAAGAPSHLHTFTPSHPDRCRSVSRPPFKRSRFGVGFGSAVSIQRLCFNAVTAETEYPQIGSSFVRAAFAHGLDMIDVVPDPGQTRPTSGFGVFDRGKVSLGQRFHRLRAQAFWMTAAL